MNGKDNCNNTNERAFLIECVRTLCKYEWNNFIKSLQDTQSKEYKMFLSDSHYTIDDLLNETIEIGIKEAPLNAIIEIAAFMNCSYDDAILLYQYTSIYSMMLKLGTEDN